MRLLARTLGLGGRCRLPGTRLAEHHALGAFQDRVLRRQRKRLDERKSGTLESASPLWNAQQTTISQPPLCILKKPIAMQQGPAEVQAILDGGVFVQYKQASRAQRPAHLLQSESDVARIVQNVC